ncbi:hypothetical protein ACOMHN_044420 [Nucella lapillus]
MPKLTDQKKPTVMEYVAFFVFLTLTHSVSCAHKIYGEIGDSIELPQGLPPDSPSTTSSFAVPAATALPSMGKIKNYFHNHAKNEPKISNMVTRVKQRNIRPRLRWQRLHRHYAIARQRMAGAQHAGRVYLMRNHPKPYTHNPRRMSGHRNQRLAFGNQNPASAAQAHNPKRKLDHRNQQLALVGTRPTPSAAQAQSSGDKAGRVLDQSRPESDDAGNGKKVNVRINAKKTPRTNDRRWLRLVPYRAQIRYPVLYQGQWISTVQNSQTRDNPSSEIAEALAMMTQRLSKMETSLARLEEAIVLQGAAHLRSSDKTEKKLTSQAKEISKNFRYTQDILETVKQCCACSERENSQMLHQYGVTPAEANSTRFYHHESDIPPPLVYLKKHDRDYQESGGTTTSPEKKEVWNGLSVTFGVNPFDPNVFADLPRTVSDANTHGWTKIADCDNNSKFRGVRYVKNNDYAVVLLFDVNGYVAGIQCGVGSMTDRQTDRQTCRQAGRQTDNDYAVVLLFDVNGYVAGIQWAIAKSGLPSTYPPAKQRGYIYQDDGDHFTLTAYFLDPAHICTVGRSASQYSVEGTGNALYIQNGSDPVTQSIRVPSTQSAVSGTGWTLGHCFPAMGVHYWYSVTTEMSCDDFQPVFLLYNEKKLTAFGWAVGVNQSSKRFEHPPQSVISAFMNPVPKCLSNYAHLSTMHIYMTAHPSQNLC